MPTYLTFLLFAIFGKLLETLANFSWGRRALLKYPRLFSYGLFSREGPNEQQLAQTRFQMKFLGHGYSQGAAIASVWSVFACATCSTYTICTASTSVEAYALTTADMLRVCSVSCQQSMQCMTDAHAEPYLLLMLLPYLSTVAWLVCASLRVHLSLRHMPGLVSRTDSLQSTTPYMVQHAKTPHAATNHHMQQLVCYKHVPTATNLPADTPICDLS